jgi:hypothetical protein
MNNKYYYKKIKIKINVMACGPVQYNEYIEYCVGIIILICTAHQYHLHTNYDVAGTRGSGG